MASAYSHAPRPHYDELEQSVFKLQKENNELREKYATALKLLQLYRSRAELSLSGSKRREDTHARMQTDVRPPSDHFISKSPPPAEEKKDILSRYLEIQQARRSSEQPLRDISPKAKKTNMWRERLLRMNSISPRKELRVESVSPKTVTCPDLPQNEVFQLAEKLNSGEFRLPDQPECPEEISQLLSSFSLKS